MKLNRLPDWDRRLACVTEKHIGMPAEWGVCDCLLTAADAIEAVTGKDLASSIRGTYSDQLGALRAMRRRKCKTVEEVFAKRFPAIGPLSAWRGDVGVIDINGVLSAGYFTEYGFAVKADHGLVFRPMTDVARAFQIGGR